MSHVDIITEKLSPNVAHLLELYRSLDYLP